MFPLQLPPRDRQGGVAQVEAALHGTGASQPVHLRALLLQG